MTTGEQGVCNLRPDRYRASAFRDKIAMQGGCAKSANTSIPGGNPPQKAWQKKEMRHIPIGLAHGMRGLMGKIAIADGSGAEGVALFPATELQFLVRKQCRAPLGAV